MKKIILFALLFSAFRATAQTSIGVRAGLNFSKFVFSGADVDPAETDLIKNISGLSFAIPIEFKINDNFAVQPELGYTQKGYKIKIDFLGLPFSAKTRINYFDLPILGKLSAGGEKAKFNVLAGPSLGYALNGSVYDGENTTAVNFKDESINRLDLGLQFGAGASFMMGSTGRLFLDARYALGLSNLHDKGANSEDVNARNRGFGINVGYLYTLGGKN